MTEYTRVLVVLITVTSCTCHMEPYIVGGHFAKIDLFPHAVYLWATEGKADWICGASILNQRLLLTAAHCLDECINNWSVKAYAGSATVSKMKLVRHVARYIIHRDYEARRTFNDIALAFLSATMPLGPTIKRVIIKSSFGDVQVAQVAGWGMVNDQTEEDTDVLKSVPQKLQSASICRKVGHFIGGMMCFTNNKNNRPTKGDSGSALIYQGQQIGLVSFRHPLLPELVVYTNVSYYYTWITDSARRLYCRRNKGHKIYLLSRRFLTPLQPSLKYIISMGCYYDGKLDHSCGSSILNQKVLLTAARCLYRPKEKWNIKAFAGSENDEKDKIIRKVKHYLIHPGYNHEHHSNNIGLANLIRSLTLGPNVKRVIIHPTFGNTANAMASSLRTDKNADSSNTLMSGKQTVQDEDSCKKVYDEMGAPTSTGMFCGIDNTKNFTSQSYYGDALMSDDDKSIQIGIVSFRSELHPRVVYTNVTYYYPWVEHFAQILFCTNRTIMYISANKDNLTIV